MKAVIMAGGFGTRIRPLTYSLPKPMLPLANIPILEHSINLLKENGFNELIFLLFFQPEIIKNYFRDGADFGVKITYVTPPEDYGTAGAVKTAEEYLKDDELFLIISGDLLTDINLKKIIKFHKDKEALITIGLVSVKNPLQFGVVITDKKGKIIKFLEKPGWGEVFSDTINAGIYVLSSAAFKYIPKNKSFDFSKDLFPTIHKQNLPLYGCTLKGFWRDIGNSENYFETAMNILKGQVHINIPGTRLDIVGKDVRLGKEVQIADNVNFEGTVIIGSNVRIDEGVKIKDCIIGDNCVLSQNSKLTRCIIWNNVFIGETSKCEESIICSFTKIGKSVLVESNCVIAERCSIGDESTVKEGIKIWPEKEVEAGSVVSTNLVWGERWKRTLFEESKIVGITNVEMTPELAAKLGAAYASILPIGSSILTARENFPASRMLKRAFVAGVLSAGVDVKDLRAMPLPMMRFKLQTFGEVGGVYFRSSLENPMITKILFFDSSGIEVNTTFEKSLERIFWREDFRRSHQKTVGKISDILGITDFYKEAFLKSLNIDLIKEKKFKVVIDFSFGICSDFLSSILNTLGCEIISLNAYSGHTETLNVNKNLKMLSQILQTTSAVAGFWLDPWAEKVYFVDEKGNIYKDTESLFLLFSLFTKTNPNTKIALPSFLPSFIEKKAKENNCTIIRTSNNRRDVIIQAKEQHSKFAAFSDGSFIFPNFQLAYDGMFTIAKTLEMLAQINIPLSKLKGEIPDLNYFHSTIPCSFEKKGAVMRTLSEEAMDKNAVFLDGIKLMFEDSWVLVFPDQYRSLIHIFAEAKTKEKAEFLLNKFVKKINNVAAEN